MTTYYAVENDHFITYDRESYGFRRFCTTKAEALEKWEAEQHREVAQLRLQARQQEVAARLALPGLRAEARGG